MSPGRFGLPRSARLPRSADFQRVMRRGSRAVTEHFVVFSAKAPEERGRLGITVSKKTGNAVRRNRVKRLIREVYRNCAPGFARETDIVVLARKQASFDELLHEDARSELERAFEKLGLLERPGR